eukprot:TRINITY_DN9585_c0_g1_i1.p1 TRINITY_DN9585_c0_g1~~TRINITY_DN9585_c0_g1_i1.p1  ORF type:complete len:232 (+),score=70.65 TRINITY_DN9585_c0_g1_i1:147-842(+)
MTASDDSNGVPQVIITGRLVRKLRGGDTAPREQGTQRQPARQLRGRQKPHHRDVGKKDEHFKEEQQRQSQEQPWRPPSFPLGSPAFGGGLQQGTQPRAVRPSSQQSQQQQQQVEREERTNWFPEIRLQQQQQLQQQHEVLLREEHQRKLDSIRNVVSDVEKAKIETKKEISEEMTRVSAIAKELHEKEYRFPTRGSVCSSETAACAECYRENPKEFVERTRAADANSSAST